MRRRIAEPSSHRALSLAVVADAGRLEDRRVGRRRDRRRRFDHRVRARPGSRTSTRNCFSRMRSWAIATAAGDGATRRRARQELERCRRRVLELDRDDIGHSWPARSSAASSPNSASKWTSATALAGAAGRDRAPPCGNPSSAPRSARSGRAARRRACRSWRRAGSASCRGSCGAAACSPPLVAVAVQRRPPSSLSSAAQHRHREQRRIRRPGLADRERRRRYAGRHLHDRQQRVLAAEVARRAPERRARARSSWRRASPAGAPLRRRRR